MLLPHLHYRLLMNVSTDWLLLSDFPSCSQPNADAHLHWCCCHHYRLGYFLIPLDVTCCSSKSCRPPPLTCALPAPPTPTHTHPKLYCSSCWLVLPSSLQSPPLMFCYFLILMPSCCLLPCRHHFACNAVAIDPESTCWWCFLLVLPFVAGFFIHLLLMPLQSVQQQLL